MDDRLEASIVNRIRHWLDGCPGEDGEKGIPGHFVTRARLMAAGLYGHELDRAFTFATDPYNHGIDRHLTHKDCQRHADAVRGWLR